ncbi:hypothetical protein AVEN_77761-1 [Araneus ventricosus]|uniref:Uncharacterized protein n=1 Tax=Araneus ventricosus TaxID=182803 RepID=A0A4Y2BFT7_ARAVE|nr:hypothetical protein AVEN_77761-1 [Araneus ventricosus]
MVFVNKIVDLSQLLDQICETVDSLLHLQICTRFSIQSTYVKKSKRTFEHLILFFVPRTLTETVPDQVRIRERRGENNSAGLPPAGVVRKFEEGMPAQVSPSSSDRG